MAGYKTTAYIHPFKALYSLSSTCLPATLYNSTTMSSCILINVTGVVVIVFVTLPFILNELWNFHFDFRRVSKVLRSILFLSFTVGRSGEGREDS